VLSYGIASEFCGKPVMSRLLFMQFYFNLMINFGREGLVVTFSVMWRIVDLQPT